MPTTSHIVEDRSNAFEGMPYLQFLQALSTQWQPQSYIEIGTNTGTSLRCFDCDAVCIDPKFQITGDCAGKRKRTLLFQMSSDDFFHQYDLGMFFPNGFDIAFLDGLHLFEFLLRDFINVEQHCHAESLVLMHDCLPLNFRMAERKWRRDEQEDPSTRGAWTGDVWRMLPILKKFRPDLNVAVLDCPPTGLVAITGMKRDYTVLRDAYSKILAEFNELDLVAFGLKQLRSIFPLLDSRLVIEADLKQCLRLTKLLR